MEGSFEHDNELSSSIKCWEVLEKFSNWGFSRTAQLCGRSYYQAIFRHLVPLVHEEEGLIIGTHCVTIPDFLFVFSVMLKTIRCTENYWLSFVSINFKRRIFRSYKYFTHEMPTDTHFRFYVMCPCLITFT
jgi:hypothetical protein